MINFVCKSIWTLITFKVAQGSSTFHFEFYYGGIRTSRRSVISLHLVPSQIDVHVTRSLGLSHLTLFQQFIVNYSNSPHPPQIIATLNAPNKVTSDWSTIMTVAIIWR